MTKVLIVLYYWPPAGGPGVQRWLKFVKYLPDFGYEPIVFAPENPFYPLQDAELLKEVPNQVKVVKYPIREPYSLAKIFNKRQTQTLSSGIISEKDKQGFIEKLLLFIRGNLFIPDARVGWVKPATKFLESYLKENNISKVITTGPPHSLHLIGLALKRKCNITWFADFRDPWTHIGYHKDLFLLPASQKRHERLETTVLQQADAIITTSYGTAEEFKNKSRRPIRVITNGYDGDIKKQITLKKDKFILAHVGSLLTNRNPKNLWQALAELRQENDKFLEYFELQLSGKVSEEVVKSIVESGLSDCLINKGYVSVKKAFRFMYEAHLLTLIEINSPQHASIIPGKLFAYLKAQRPILAIGPQNWDVNKIFEQVGYEPAFEYTEKAKIKAYIRNQFNGFLQGKTNFNSTNKIEDFHRRNLTRNLASFLNEQE
ncbi:glycosyltransferase family 4 protein [Mesonia sp. HuA40]|uniref:glycosyltransferase family 4 protein n=1 Tax=Mesonia sp. HuA40 TaxID=2602761 RepID=UPI0011CAD5AB|nr:glycosyltransferase family 4 protein [Mesonia sp. HuA40]TXK70914.1 glycosyltransferase family 4 protein [Mesonia sp. HuA40]